jgi:hypothetical protein
MINPLDDPHCGYNKRIIQKYWQWSSIVLPSNFFRIIASIRARSKMKVKAIVKKMGSYVLTYFQIDCSSTLQIEITGQNYLRFKVTATLSVIYYFLNMPAGFHFVVSNTIFRRDTVVAFECHRYHYRQAERKLAQVLKKSASSLNTRHPNNGTRNISSIVKNLDHTKFLVLSPRHLKFF